MTKTINIAIPKISIIIPTFNSAKTLHECIESISEQTYSNIEIIIIDGVSTDDTIDIIKRYASNNKKIRFISEKDKGIYDAMNKGIDMAEGDFLFFLGSDDKFYNKHVIYNIFSQPQNFNKYDVIYGNVLFKISQKIYDRKFSAYKLLHKNICHQGIFTRKELFSILGKFEIHYKALADWVFNMKWFNNKNIKHNYLNYTIAVYNEDGYCFNNPDIDFQENRQHIEKEFFPWLPLFLYKNKHKRPIGFITRLLYGY